MVIVGTIVGENTIKKETHSMETTNNKQYFFCYSRELSNYLHYKHQFGIITVAINPQSKKTFSLFKQSPELAEAVKKYSSKYQRQY
jgi:hypothetical protein